MTSQTDFPIVFDQLKSIGPPGAGKTTVARLVAQPHERAAHIRVRPLLSVHRIRVPRALADRIARAEQDRDGHRR